MLYKSSMTIPARKDISIVRRKIINWYKKNGRVYPWRETNDPFRILIAEMMLRRTKADQVKPVYEQFFKEYPDIDSLSEAKEGELEKILYPLGLKWRVPAFGMVAREVREKYQSRIPETREDLTTLPGVGDYVAGAVLSIAYGKKEWVVDSNIVRIFKRYFGIKTSKEGRRDKHVVEIAKIYASGKDPGRATMGILDITALVCKPGEPDCGKCSLVDRCHYALSHKRNSTERHGTAYNEIVGKVLNPLLMVQVFSKIWQKPVPDRFSNRTKSEAKDILKEVKMNFKTSFLTLMFVVIFCSGVSSKNIAVIPFTNITKDEEKDWIGAGFSETLTAKLGKVKSISLIEREQLSKILKELKFQYSGFVDEKTAIEVGKIYGVDIMVLGSFQIIGDSLRASARFVDVQTGKIIDTAETTGNIQDIFKLQDDIAFSLLNSLNIVLGEKEKEEIKINPTENLSAYEWFAKGYKAYNLKEYDFAIEYWTNAIRIDIEYADAYNNRGVAYSKKGDYNSAIYDFNKAIQINPQYAEAYYNRGVAYGKKGDYNSAIYDFNKAIQINPQLAEAYYNRGLTYYNKGDYNSAIYDYTKAIQLNPQLAFAYINRGIAYADKGDYNSAIYDFNKAIQINPQLAEAYNNRGAAYCYKGDYNSAIYDYTKAIQLNPQYAFAYVGRGTAYEKLGNCTKANADYKKACELGYEKACSYTCY